MREAVISAKRQSRAFEKLLRSTKNKSRPLDGSMAALIVALSISIKALLLVYPGRGLMAVRGGEDHAVTFTVLKKAYCGPLSKVLVLKAF